MRRVLSHAFALLIGSALTWIALRGDLKRSVGDTVAQPTPNRAWLASDIVLWTTDGDDKRVRRFRPVAMLPLGSGSGEIVLWEKPHPDQVVWFFQFGEPNNGLRVFTVEK